MGAIGPWQITLVVVVVFLLFGASRFGKMGKGLGQGLRDLKRGITGQDFKEAQEQLKETTVAVSDVSAATRKKTI